MNSVRIRNMRCDRAGRFVIGVHATRHPSDEEWQEAMSLYTEMRDEPGLAALVYTTGGAPNAAQRAQLNVATGGRAIRIAVLTTSATARTVGIAIRWFNPNIRIFAPTEIEPALAHLEANADERELLRASLVDLRARLDHDLRALA